MSNFILLENRIEQADTKSSFLFENPVKEWCCYKPEELSITLAEMQQFQKQGYYLVGYIAYEASYFINPVLEQDSLWTQTRPLLHFFAFKDQMILSQKDVEDFLQSYNRHHFYCTNIGLIDNHETYTQKFTRLKNHLYEGDSYQVNLTTKYKFDFHGSSIALYKRSRMRQKVAYGGILKFSNYSIVSLSPELFFRKTGENLETMPMKGTTPRSLTPELDLYYKNQLLENEKIVSENMIIVDLLRNDLSLIAKPSTLKVEKLFSLETYETLHQMTSHISCKIDNDTSFIDIFKHIFPCGSITGAPKKRTMQIIHELESEPRHIYTGSIGYITPQNDMCFNVAIRTFYLEKNQGELGVGGGVTYDSIAEDEYTELKLKANFFTDFKLIESILYHHEYYLLDAHLKRLKTSAHQLKFTYPENEIRLGLENTKKQMVKDRDYKVRLILSKSGEFSIEYLEAIKITSRVTIILYEQEYVQSSDPYLRHKTINSFIREFYQNIKSQYPDFFDVLFINEKQEITETSTGNIMILKDKKWYTPPIHSGILPGVMRNHLLNTMPDLKEKVLYKHDLVSADEIFIINSVRGIMGVDLCLNY